MSSNSVIPLFYEALNVGKRIKSSKKRFTWKFELDGKQYQLDLYVSRLSGKRTVLLNGDVRLKSRTSGIGSNYPLKIGRHAVIIVQIGDLDFDVRIDSVSFASLYRRRTMQAQQQQPGSGLTNPQPSSGFRTLDDPFGQSNNDLEYHATRPTSKTVQQKAGGEDELAYKPRARSPPKRVESPPRQRTPPRQKTPPKKKEPERQAPGIDLLDAPYSHIPAELFKGDPFATEQPIKSKPAFNEDPYGLQTSPGGPDPFGVKASKGSPQAYVDDPFAGPKSRSSNSSQEFVDPFAGPPVKKSPQHLPQQPAQVDPFGVSGNPFAGNPDPFAGGQQGNPFGEQQDNPFKDPFTAGQEQANPFDEEQPRSQDWNSLVDLDNLHLGNKYSPAVLQKMQESQKTVSLPENVPNIPMNQFQTAKPQMTQMPQMNPMMTNGMMMNPQMAQMYAYNQYMTNMMMGGMGQFQNPNNPR